MDKLLYKSFDKYPLHNGYKKIKYIKPAEFHKENTMKPRVRLHESCIEQAKQLLYGQDNIQRYELSAILVGEEQNNQVTLTELVIPQREKILLLNPQDSAIAMMNDTDYELISTSNRNFLTPRYWERLITKKVHGRNHNHPAGSESPTVSDMVGASECLPLMEPKQRYFIEIIYAGRSTHIFFYRAEDLYYIQKKKKEGIPYAVIQKWLDKNIEKLRIKDFEVLKGH